jgi:hypothetical protein
MSAIEPTHSGEAGEVLRTTLLDLVWKASEEEEREEQLVAGVEQRLRGGQVQLTGNFRGVPIEQVLAGIGA